MASSAAQQRRELKAFVEGIGTKVKRDIRDAQLAFSDAREDAQLDVREARVKAGKFSESLATQIAEDRANGRPPPQQIDPQAAPEIVTGPGGKGSAAGISAIASEVLDLTSPLASPQTVSTPGQRPGTITDTRTVEGRRNLGSVRGFNIGGLGGGLLEAFGNAVGSEGIANAGRSVSTQKFVSTSTRPDPNFEDLKTNSASNLAGVFQGVQNGTMEQSELPREMNRMISAVGPAEAKGVVQRASVEFQHNRQVAIKEDLIEAKTFGRFMAEEGIDIAQYRDVAIDWITAKNIDEQFDAADGLAEVFRNSLDAQIKREKLAGAKALTSSRTAAERASLANQMADDMVYRLRVLQVGREQLKLEGDRMAAFQLRSKTAQSNLNVVSGFNSEEQFTADQRTKILSNAVDPKGKLNEDNLDRVARVQHDEWISEDPILTFIRKDDSGFTGDTFTLTTRDRNELYNHVRNLGNPDASRESQKKSAAYLRDPGIGFLAGEPTGDSNVWKLGADPSHPNRTYLMNILGWIVNTESFEETMGITLDDPFHTARGGVPGVQRKETPVAEIAPKPTAAVPLSPTAQSTRHAAEQANLIIRGMMAGAMEAIRESPQADLVRLGGKAGEIGGAGLAGLIRGPQRPQTPQRPPAQ